MAKDKSDFVPWEERHKVGRVVITCPACGDALTTLVRVGMVNLTNRSVNVSFSNAEIEHICAGRE